MKKYFAKYVKVGGEISVGDIVYEKLTTGKEGLFEIHTLNDISKEDQTRALLCLCSADVQEGDKIRLLPNPLFQDKLSGIEYNRLWSKVLDENPMLPPFMFKIIGAISKGAVWVKEGDEFIADRDDCEVFPYHTHDKDGQIIYTNEYDEPVDMPIYTIQCPACKMFH